MTYQIEDIAPQLKAEKEQRDSQRLEQSRYTVGVGISVAEIQGDSKWAVYLNHMNSLIESAERQVRGWTYSLISAFALLTGRSRLSRSSRS